MTLFEFLAFILTIAGLVAGWQSASDTGVWGAILGAAKGAAVGFACYAAGLFMILSSLALGLRYRPPFPLCRSGRCGAEHYTYLYLDSAPTGRDKQLEEENEGKLMRCRCGTLYFRSLRERKFYEVRADRTLLAFMRHLPFGRWRPDLES